MRSSICVFLAVVGVAAFVGSPDSLWSQTSPVSVSATFDKDYFDSAEPMGVTITAVNTTGKYLLVNKGFSSKLFHLEMRLIDPAGRLLLPKCDQPRTEFPDAPPLGFVLCDGVPTRIAPYEVLPPQWSVTQRTDDLRDCYTIKLSGHYSAQVQLSVMVFRESDSAPIVDPCYGGIKNYESLEVVKSEPQTLYKQGSTEVNVIPKYWLRAWQDGLHLIPDIAVTIWPQEGRVADDYSLDNIQLNNVTARSAVKMYSFLRKKEYVLALFDKQQAINSLGQIVVGQSYPVVVSGTMKNREYFSGGHEVQIIGVNPE